MRIKIKVNRVIKYLILSDLAFWSGWGLITPIFSIFIVERIEGGSVFVAGAAAGIYWILKSALRIPIGLFLDKCLGEKDDYWFVTTGLFVAALIPFGFIFARTPAHIYALQAIHAVAMAVSLSGWSAIFTRHIDKGKEATEWAISDTVCGIGIGITGLLGGWAVSRFGFDSVFITVGISGLIGALLLLSLKNDISGVFDQGFKINLKDIFNGEENEKSGTI